MYKYKITSLEANKEVAEKEMNELGADGWMLVNIVEYDGRIIWVKEEFNMDKLKEQSKEYLEWLQIATKELFNEEKTAA